MSIAHYHNIATGNRYDRWCVLSHLLVLEDADLSAAALSLALSFALFSLSALRAAARSS